MSHPNLRVRSNMTISFFQSKTNIISIAALIESVPAITKAEITDVTTIIEALKLLDLDYGNLQE